VLAQVSVEFIAFVAVLSILLFLTVYQSSTLYFQLNSARILKDAQSISDQIASEINLALKVGDGYSRIFYLPKKISDSLDYEVSVEDYRVVVKWKDGSTQSVILTKNITGQILKGKNFIRNVEGIIYVNQ